MTSADKLSNACSKNKFTPHFTLLMPKRSLSVKLLRLKKRPNSTPTLSQFSTGKKIIRKLQKNMKRYRLKESAKCLRINGRPKRKKKREWSRNVTFLIGRGTSLLLNITNKRNY